MDVNDVGMIVDSLADKVGMAAERIQPVAETMIQEVVRSNTFMAWAYLGIWPLFVAIGVALFWGGFKLAKLVNDSTDACTLRIIGGILGVATVLFSTIICLCEFVEHYTNAMQPTTIVVQRILGGQ